jgi:hypothetical protein
MVINNVVKETTMDELKDFYKSLDIKNRDTDPLAKNVELYPFEEQIKNEGKYGIKMLSWLEQTFEKNGDVMIRLKSIKYKIVSK